MAAGLSQLPDRDQGYNSDLTRRVGKALRPLRVDGAKYQNVSKREGVEKLTPARALIAELVRHAATEAGKKTALCVCSAT